MIRAIEETVIKSTCDCLWGRNECPNRAAWLVRHTKTKMYSIMCEVHKKDFESIYPNAPVEYHLWTLSLNKQFAEEVRNGK